MNGRKGAAISPECFHDYRNRAPRSAFRKTTRGPLVFVLGAVPDAHQTRSRLATNSLGILSEALHSSLDLVAAGITFFAVRVAARPADETHPYGYGKIENLSALAETVLLLVTCGWIVHEAVNRLFFDAPEITPSWWGVIIILISLLVDVNRAAMLRRVAQKHKSQALEADALHFTTDIWSSGVVLVGLLCVQASEYLPADSPFRGILHMADAIAALFVSGIVVVVGFRLSRRAVTMLLDGGGKEHSEALEQALAKQLPLCRVRRLRVRESGADVFMDITVEAPATLRLDAAHDVSCVIEDIAHEIVPSADITVHVEPAQEETESMLQLVRTVAAAHKLSVHNLILSEQSGGLLVFLHVEASPDMTLREAHEYVVMFEESPSASASTQPASKRTSSRKIASALRKTPCPSTRISIMCAPPWTAYSRNFRWCPMCTTCA